MLKEASKIGKPKHRKKNSHRLAAPGSGEPDSSSSSSSSSDESSTNEDSSGMPSDSEIRTLNHSKKRKSKKSRKADKPSDFMPVFKPLVYNRQPNLLDYHCFMCEATSYIEIANIPEKYQIVMVSHYLKDTAYNFYNLKVTVNEKDWTLSQFLTELFNFCFPVDYCIQIRKKLNKLYQNDKSVNAFIYEVEQLYGMIRSTNKQEKVIKLWYGLQPVIQEALWQDGLNPEIHIDPSHHN